MSVTRRHFLATSAALAAGAAAPRALALGRGRSPCRVRQVLRGMPTVDGAGVQLTRVIGQPALRHLDPFVMLDRFHSDDPSAYVRGFPDHPHRGFETVTVMLDGRVRHHDSKGNAGLIQGGGVQWMTAGRGIVHSEMPEATRGFVSGFQFWINLPAREKMRAQEYQDLPAPRLTHVPLGGGGRVDLIAGRALDARGPVEPRVTEPLLLVATLENDAPLTLPVAPGHNAFLFVHAGNVLLGDRDRVESPEIALLVDGNEATVRADRIRSVIIFATGRPIGEPIVQSGPFVMNTEAEIRKAWDDYRNGTLVL